MLIPFDITSSNFRKICESKVGEKLTSNFENKCLILYLSIIYIVDIFI